jgi:hypothetical protein
LLAKPLCDATKQGKRKSLIWEFEQQQAFHVIKKALVSAPALGLPDERKPFFLYVHERSGMATGVLTQFLGSWHGPMDYLSKQLDSLAKGWPPCLRAHSHSLAGIKTEKLTLGGEITVRVPHLVMTQSQKLTHWLQACQCKKLNSLHRGRALQLELRRLLTYTQTLNMVLPLFMCMGLYIYMSNNNLKPSHSTVASEFR